MAYNPHNVDMFTAVYAGALTGMTVSNRIPKNTSAASYAEIAKTAGAFAKSFDTVWGAQATTQADIDMARFGAANAWSQRTPINSSKNQTASTYDDLVNALVAIVNAAKTYYASEGITPSTAGIAPGSNGQSIYNDAGQLAGAPKLGYDKVNDYCILSEMDATPAAFGYTWRVTETGNGNAVMALVSNDGTQPNGMELSSELDVGFKFKATGIGGVRGAYSFGRNEAFNFPYVNFGVSSVIGGGDGAIQIRKAYVIPVGALDPLLGFLYVDPATGALHYLSPAGTNTAIGPA